MPLGKPAGVRCVQLDERDGCRLFGRPERPAVCGGLKPSSEMCGQTREYALQFLGRLERLTAPGLNGPHDLTSFAGRAHPEGRLTR